MADGSRGYAHCIDILSDTTTVWRALTDSESLSRWCMPGAKVVPRTGGIFRANVDRAIRVEAHIDVFDPPRRLRVIHLPSTELGSSDSAIVDDFLLESVRGGTIVRLLGSGVPAAMEWDAIYRGLRVGWERAIARLKCFVEADRDSRTAGA
jgi:uncharacterized protein YndB with AHSA1/START domain